MRKPAAIAYGADDSLPLGVNVLSGLQQVGLTSIYLIFPALLVKEAGGSLEVAAAVVSLTLIALAIGTLLQTIRVGPVGSGYLCQPDPSVLYFVPSLYAARHGGLPAVFGMTVAAGLFEAALARVLRRMRSLFPPEIAGLVVLLAGISTGIVGMRTALGPDVQQVPPTGDLLIGLGTLVLMIVLNIWGRGGLHRYCVLIGMAAGYAASRIWPVVDTGSAGLLAGGGAAAPWFAIPDIGHLGWSSDPSLLLPFGVAAVAAALKAMGNVTTCQKAGDADWVRPDMGTIGSGVVADGLGTAIAGALGTQGLSSSTGAIGLASATGVMSRHVGWSVAAILFALAFLPGLGRILYLMPRPVAGAALLFASTFIIINGLQIMTSRLLDARKTLMIGLALVVGLSVEVFPGMLVILPAGMREAFGSALVLGTLVALVMNGLFRIGLRKSATMIVDPAAPDHVALDAFMEERGGLWGARRDVIERARHNLWQSIDTLAGGGIVRGPLEVKAAFDEFSLDVRVAYDGPALPLPETRPSADEIVDTEDGERRLAGYLLRRFADRVGVDHRNGRSTLVFHFDH
jgi:NCS2 family nucleobase:cation symporter-2